MIPLVNPSQLRDRFLAILDRDDVIAGAELLYKAIMQREERSAKTDSSANDTQARMTHAKY